MPIKLIIGSCTQSVLGLELKAGVLNCETEILPKLFTIQVPTPTEYNTVLVPIVAKFGVSNPEGEMALFAVQVPPPGTAVNNTELNVLHKGGGILRVGVVGL
jgi:hypothetical protein